MKRTVKRAVVLTLGVAALLALQAGVALADAGPHGGYTGTNSPDGCAACHRAHTARGPMLLVASTTYELCVTCHGSAATGAQTNVMDGLYAEGAIDAGGQGVKGASLLGGGFVNAVMNTNFAPASPASRAVTSTHSVGGVATGTVWGFGPISATANTGLASVALDCTSCHNPHGNAGSAGQATYRILRTQPHGVGTLTTNADVPDQLTKRYTIGSYADGHYMGEFYDGYGAALARWCSQCHTRYLADSSGGHVSSGDAVFKYRHYTNTNFFNCLTCHVAHGSTATMGGYADMAPATSPGATTATDSTLLRMDNRGVCAQCHLDTGGAVVR